MKLKMEELKRPSLKENEEDLFHEQELFFKNKGNISVSLKNIKKPGNASNKETSGPLDNAIPVMQEKEELVIHQEEVILEVQEHPMSEEPFVFKLPSISPNDVANLLEERLKSSKFSKRRKEQRLQTSAPSIKKEKTEEENSKCLLSVPDLSTTSLIVDGSGLEHGSDDAKSIHQENQAKISGMSKQEILKCQNQLKNTLDPNLIEFIRSKKKKAPELKKESFKATFYMQNKTNQTSDQDLGKILRQEGRDDCDALLLQKSFKQTEFDEKFYTNFKNKNKVLGIPKEVKELIKESSKSKWQNMDRVESEKLEWLSDLPKPNPIDLKTGFSARFDFEGKLLAPDVDVPIHEGLHHHGEEPEVAGYSLEELFLLARSTLQSQRITALHTIAHILDNYWYGMMDHCFEGPLLPIILQAGIVPLLRWALDDTSITSVAATVTAIHSLLISKADEACLHKTFCWLNGHLLPQVKPMNLDEPNVPIEELTDADLIKLDVIKGFLRIDILPRFMYILQVMQPPPLVCKLIVEICAHIAQHSKDAATQVTKYFGLLQIIFEKFLPLSWKYIDGSKLTDTVNYSQPLSSAMKLIRIIISSSRELAWFLMENFDLMKILTLYLTIHPMDEKLSLPDIQSLMVETLKTLHMLLLYGFGFEIFLDLYPVFLRQTEFCLSLDMTMEVAKHCQDFEYAAHLFKTFDALVTVTHENKNSDLQSVMLTIFKQAILCLKKWLYQVKQEKASDVSANAMSLLAAALNFVSTYYNKAHEGLTCNDWKPCSVVKDMYSNYLIPFIKSENFKVLLEKIKSCSLLLSKGFSGYKRDSKTMASLGSIGWKQDIVPLLKEDSCIPLLLATFNFIFIHKSLFNDGENLALEELLNNNALTEYLNKIYVSKLKTGSWFIRYETLFISLLLKLSLFTAQKNLLQWHAIAMAILSILKMPDESLIEDIFENIIFSKKYLPISDSIKDKDAVLNLPVIAQCYSSYFLQKSLVSKSRFLLHGNLKLESISCPSNPNQLLPKDWCFAPIFDLYQESSKKQNSAQLASEDILLVMSTLQWILLCHHLSLPLLNNISASLQYCYLSMVFLLDFDSFQLPKISSLLKANFLALLKEKPFDFSKMKSDNINSFEDLYLDLLNHYIAWSCGDHLFGNCILIPVQQSFENRWKKLLLTDHSEALQFLRVPLTKLIVPLQNYLYPYETDTDCLKKYLELLFQGSLTNKRCPLLYLMAVHHIHQYIFLKSEKNLKFQKYFAMSITKTKNTILKNQLLLYSEVNIESEFGFNIKGELTQEEEQHLKDILK